MRPCVRLAVVGERERERQTATRNRERGVLRDQVAIPHIRAQSDAIGEREIPECPISFDPCSTT